jgi:tRNA threonylcarbamoyladenosine biosynthesis protein TsaB
LLLAIDTATRVTGLALYDQAGLHMEHMWLSGDNHTVELMPYIVRACEQQGLVPSALRALAVSLGPGSFTGLRVGLSVAKGLALALGIPVLGVPTLDAIAYGHSREVLPVCAVLPAGRGRWCTALYRHRPNTGGTEYRPRPKDGETEYQPGGASGWQRSSDYVLVSTDDLIALLQEPTLICGELDQSLEEVLRTRAAERAVIASPALRMRRAGYLGELAWQRFSAGEWDELSSLTPIYLQHA